MDGQMTWRQRLAARIPPESVRARVENVNDGILAISGFSQGLSAGDEVRNLLSPIILLAAFAGALSVTAIELTSELAERDAELLVAEEEQRRLSLNHEEQLAEIADYYQARGVTPETARKVAEELDAADSLGTQLDIEGFDERITLVGAALGSLWSGAAFLLGAMVPILISVLVPWNWRDEYTTLAVIVAMAFTSILLAQLGHTRIWQTLLRSAVIGVAALASSYLLGALLL